MAVRYKISIFFLSFALILGAGAPVQSTTVEQLELLAGSDFIPEVRAAASRALAKKYVQLGFQPDKLEAVASKGRTDELRDAAINALARKFEDVKKVGSLQEAQKKAEELEAKIKSGEASPAIKTAASEALGLYYLAFNLNNLEGYSMEELEEIATGEATGGLKEAAGIALESIYPNHYSAGELKQLIRTSPHETIKRGAAGALAIRYASQMPPSPSLAELRATATDVEENSWLREAAGRAYGKSARGKVAPEELEELASDGPTEEIREGAAMAWASSLISSDRSRTELLRMACAATGYKSAAYGSAVIKALADRMLKANAARQGG